MLETVIKKAAPVMVNTPTKTAEREWPFEQIVLLGQTGMLGGAILASQDLAGRGQCNIVLPDARLLMRQVLNGNLEGVNALRSSVNGRQVWIYAVGSIDPHAPERELMQINAEAPARLYASLCGAAADRLHFVTFGSVLEERPQIAVVNAYIRSKAQLLNAWQKEAIAGRTSWTHYQLHTLYGGRRVQPSTFLGQMSTALRQNITFYMSSGYQVREYHHASDVASSVLRHILTAPPTSTKIALNSGCAVRLRNVATAVFSHFGRLELLKMGTLAPQCGEVFEPYHSRSEYLFNFRDSVSGIIAWLKDVGVVKAAG